eukprot:1196870-Alexandrium_andersonii.AAC.1
MDAPEKFQLEQTLAASRDEGPADGGEPKAEGAIAKSGSRVMVKPAAAASGSSASGKAPPPPLVTPKP